MLGSSYLTTSLEKGTELNRLSQLENSDRSTVFHTIPNAIWQHIRIKCVSPTVPKGPEEVRSRQCVAP